MTYLLTLSASIGSIIIMFIVSKCIGYREIAQLTLLDHITAITIGSIAAEASLAFDNGFISCTIAMITYAISAVLLDYLTNKSIKLRNFVSGSPLLLYHNNMLYKKNFSKARMDISEFLSFLRSDGYFDLSAIDTILLEPNGKLSVLQKTTETPACKKDMNLKCDQEIIPKVIIIDGKIQYDVLQSINKNEQYIYHELKLNNIKNLSDVLVATFGNGKIKMYKKNDSAS